MRNCNFLRSECRALTLGLVVLASAASAQNTLTNLAGEFSVAGNLVGDQVASRTAVSASGGFVVWHDNATDGHGLGVSARRLNNSLSGDLGSFRVNQSAIGNQENPQVVLLQDGAAAFVWQGGVVGAQDIYLRIIGANGTFQTGDILVNTYTNQQQADPVVVCLGNGNLAVAWSSFGQDGSMQGVYARLFSPSGLPEGAEFRVNQNVQLNQRQPQVAALGDGGFGVVWISERLRSVGEVTATNSSTHAVEVIGRVFNEGGVAVGDEIVLSDASRPCASPAIVAVAGGGFIAGWSQSEPVNSTGRWDVYMRSFSSDGQPLAASVRVNAHTNGDQRGLKLSSFANNLLAVWTSVEQDGSREGIFGRFLSVDGSFNGGEFRVNTTTINQQMQPSVASDGVARFLVVWSGYIGGGASVDLFGQRFVSTDGLSALYPPDAPYVSALDATSVSVTWPDLAGYAVAHYELQVDGSSPMMVVGNQATLTNLSPATSYGVRLLYQLVDGRRSTPSSVASVTTWGLDNNNDGLPDDWQISLWGADSANWPAATADSDGDGASNFAEFQAGTDPLNASSVLKTRLHRSGPGHQFSWNTNPGFVYQVQSATNLSQWQNFGIPRLARGNFDSVAVPAGSAAVFYRVIRLR